MINEQIENAQNATDAFAAFLSENLDRILLAVIAIALLLILLFAIKSYNKLCHIFMSQKSAENYYCRVTEQPNTVISDMNEANGAKREGSDVRQG